jgi:hypothetical protein
MLSALRRGATPESLGIKRRSATHRRFLSMDPWVETHGYHHLVAPRQTATPATDFIEPL